MLFVGLAATLWTQLFLISLSACAQSKGVGSAAGIPLSCAPTPPSWLHLIFKGTLGWGGGPTPCLCGFCFVFGGEKGGLLWEPGSASPHPAPVCAESWENAEINK